MDLDLTTHSSTVGYIHVNVHMDRGLYVNTSLILNRNRCTEIEYKYTFHVYIPLLFFRFVMFDTSS